MRKTSLAGAAVAACLVTVLQVHAGAQLNAGGQAYPTEQQYAASKEAQQRVATAKAIAGSDLVPQFDNTCIAAGPQRPAVERQAAGQAAVPITALEPTKLFDNLYYFGFNTVGAWAVTTSDGIILIDTLNTVTEAEEVLEAGLRKVGLDPASVKYAIIGHGHFDHFGGAPYFQGKYRTRIAMGAPDWDLIERPNPNASPAQAARPRPKRDILLTDGQKVTLGDTSITIMSTPGHTAGTLALLIPVKDKGKSLTVLMLSGANTTPNPVALAAFEKALTMAKQQKAVAVLNSHAGLFGDELGWMQTIRGNPAGANPFVYSEARFARFLDIMTECARARVAALANRP